MIINFHFLQQSLLEHDDLMSCKYFVTFYNDLQVIIIEYHEFFFKICGNYLPSMNFYY